ncbi:glycosyltransferase family 9 protein, partial [Dactylosporangium sp. NPDC051485]|uniref:glycosyltransferase family 9 protein n=1 Tax=Dactylosporangium sp. NPDC051485 TaxID=3154846 RepID=UPI003430D736
APPLACCGAGLAGRRGGSRRGAPGGRALPAALAGHARLVVSGDTGVAHLATAYATPSVVLFGPASPQRRGPPRRRPQHVALWHGQAAEPGDAPGDEPHPALLSVTVAEVLAAAHRVAGRRSSPPPTAPARPATGPVPDAR